MRTPSTSLTSQEGLSYDALIKFPDGLTSDSRLSSSHARQHYDETLHAYALDTETQHVFDFAGQGYVHRLLQNKDDGKLVEVNDPNNTTSQERSLSPGLSDAQEGEVVHRKLEGFASQYYTLLKSQLEQQRIYYEGRLQEIRLEYGRYRRASNNNEARCKKSGSTADLISALKQERNQLAQRLMSLQGRHDKVSEDVVWLKSMNESLEANKEVLKRRVEESQRQRTEARNMIQQSLPLLEEKLSLLMLQLEETTSYQQVEEPRNSLKSDRKPAAKASR
jgi:BRCA1-associated protein